MNDHKKEFIACKIAVLTVSSTRNLDNDTTGKKIQEMLESKGHSVERQIVSDDEGEIIAAVKTDADVIITNGGTGITAKDVTIEALRGVFDKELFAFPALFAQLSLQQVGSAAIMSRAVAGTIGKQAIFCLPGSTAACELALTLILPELSHIKKHLTE